MSKWSSYSEHQLIFENWRNHNGQEVNELFGKKRKDEYPATEMAKIMGFVGSAIEKLKLENLTSEKIFDEFERILSKQDIVIKEQEGELYLDKKPTLNYFQEGEGEIAKFIQALKDHREGRYYKQFFNLLKNAGFELTGREDLARQLAIAAKKAAAKKASAAKKDAPPAKSAAKTTHDAPDPPPGSPVWKSDSAAPGAQPADDGGAGEAAPEEETSLTTRLKDIFGAGMDIGGLASFVPGPGQVIGGAATAASLLNNLTYDPPHYGWAAVDLAGLAVALIPAATGAVKAGKLGAKMAKAAKGAKAAKAAKAAHGAAKVADLGRAAMGYGKLADELEKDLPAVVANVIKAALTKRSDEGNYYSTQAIQKLKDKADPEKEGFKRLTAFEKKVKELQGDTELIDRSVADLFDDKLDEAQIKHWQTIAGIKKSVI